MRVLLDTHVFLWAATDSRKLKPAARAALRTASEIFVSAASIWEVAIKRRLGKIEVDPHELVATIEPSGFLPLSVSPQHAALVETLPDHHRDPFDRILVAQALAEPLRLITADRALAAYSELVIFVG